MWDFRAGRSLAKSVFKHPVFSYMQFLSHDAGGLRLFWTPWGGGGILYRIATFETVGTHLSLFPFGGADIESRTGRAARM